MKYIIKGFGDLGNPRYNGGWESGIHNPVSFGTLDDALVWLKNWATEKDNDTEEGSDLYSKIDLEDDRILITEVLDSGHSKVVWHFSGWHWDPDEFGPQGTLPGDKEPLVSILSSHY